MPYEDLEAASGWCRSVRDLVVLNPGGQVHAVVLERILELLAACHATVDDHECHSVVRQMEASATALYSKGEHYRYASGQTSGADVLRLQILRKLTVFTDRLREIDAARTAAASEQATSRRNKHQ